LIFHKKDQEITEKKINKINKRVKNNERKEIANGKR
jgi:hypothetical protein